jgi:hypothetical protein
MSYTLQAIIAHEQHLKNAVLMGTRVVSLQAGLSLIPLTEQALGYLKIPLLPLLEEDQQSLNATAQKFCRQLSLGSRLAYVEAEFFGGVGTQACVLFERGAVHEGPLIETEAINHALRFLGVQATDGKDEFDTVGLNRERKTEDWLREDAI